MRYISHLTDWLSIPAIQSSHILFIEIPLHTWLLVEEATLGTRPLLKDSGKENRDVHLLRQRDWNRDSEMTRSSNINWQL